MKLFKKGILIPFAIFISFVFSLSVSAKDTNHLNNHIATKNKIILFIWDGLRPDSITKKITPNLYRIMHKGVIFTDNHSSYPTFTMMNASSFATGDFAGKTGFYGNALWDPRAHGSNAANKPVDFQQPVFTEDYKILQDLDQPQKNDPLIFVKTLFEAAHQAHITTATIGKSGPAFFQDHDQKMKAHGIVLDEKHVYPLAFAKQLQQEKYPIPLLSPYAYPKGQLTLPPNASNPTAFSKIITLKRTASFKTKNNSFISYPEHVTSDPSATVVSPYAKSNQYLMNTYLNKILPKEHPQLSVVWLRNPDTTEHKYGVGSPSYYTALAAQDQLLGQLIDKLKQLNQLNSTDLIIASDHGHSNVSGSLSQFPLRNIHNGRVTTIKPDGYSVSGYFRPADLLTHAGFQAYDGKGCQYNPTLSGIKRNGEFVYRVKEDKTGQVCGKNYSTTQRFYTTPSYKVPNPLPKNAVVVDPNGGSTYLYVPSHNPHLIKHLVRFLQSREEFDAVFVDDRYGSLPGTLPLSLIDVKNPEKRNPDIIVSTTYDTSGVITNMRGIEYSSSGNNRGMHGSFSPIDVHNTLIAIGPDFKSYYKDSLPTGNVDVAPTIAYLLQINLPNTNGRPLLEALKNGLSEKNYHVLKVSYEPNRPAINLTMQLATNPDGKDIDKSADKYTILLRTKWLMLNNKKYIYFDSAKALRY